MVINIFSFFFAKYLGLVSCSLVLYTCLFFHSNFVFGLNHRNFLRSNFKMEYLSWKRQFILECSFKTVVSNDHCDTLSKGVTS